MGDSAVAKSTEPRALRPVGAEDSVADLRIVCKIGYAWCIR